jgi:hypothetical protein
MRKGLLWATLLGAGLTAISTTTIEQANRVSIHGNPTNLMVDWRNVTVIADPVETNVFVVLMPLHALSSWATFESALTMDTEYGAGNWLRCRMRATDWAYLSADPDAMSPGDNAGTPYEAPMSLLTTSHELGPYDGVPGRPDQPVAGAVHFAGSAATCLDGLEDTRATECWQLRTRGHFATDLWNGCPGQAATTPNFTGWLVARFTIEFT